MSSETDPQSPLRVPGSDAERRAACLAASRGCFRAFWVAALVIAVAYLGLVSAFGASVDQAWLAIKPVLIVWRFGLSWVIIGFWPEWVRRFADWAGLLPIERQVLARCRWRFAGLLVAIEVLLVQGWLDGIISITL